MQYVEVMTPQGLQRYPAYGIGGFVKNALKGVKNIVKKAAPFIPLALGFAPGFQALSPITQGIISGLSSAAAAKLTGADMDDALRAGILSGGLQAGMGRLASGSFTEGAKLRDVMSADRGGIKGLFTGYQTPIPQAVDTKQSVSEKVLGNNNVYDSASSKSIDMTSFRENPTVVGLDNTTKSVMNKIGVPKGKELEFYKEFQTYKNTIDPKAVMKDYVDVYRKGQPFMDKATQFVKSPLGAATTLAAASPLIASAFEGDQDSPNMDVQTGEDLIKDDPLKYIIQGLPISYNPDGSINFGGTQNVATGGPIKQYASGSNPMNQFVPRSGLIPSMNENGETGISDNVKALLSPNEFVYTKQAVAAKGDGDVMEGAKRMMADMKKLEAKGAQMGIGKA